MLKRLLTFMIAFLFVFSMLPALALGDVSCSLSNDSAKAGSSITVQGNADVDTWVSIKVLDQADNIVVYDAVKSDSKGEYSAVFTIPSGASGTLTVVAGYGEDVDSQNLEVKSSSGGGPSGPSPTPSEEIQVGVEEPVAPVTVLNDITGHWAKENIEKLVAMGAISGYPDGSFRPDQYITRAEFVTVLVKAFKLEASEGRVFTDTAGHWAEESIGIAAALQIAGGYSDNRFGPDDFITREQMAVMVVNAARLSKVTDAQQFTDSGQISTWAREAVEIAAGNSIITGYPDNSFKPQGNTTRAEAVTVIARALGL